MRIEKCDAMDSANGKPNFARLHWRGVV